MKKVLHITLKLLLATLIFIGLQGRVLVRYVEIFNKNHPSEITHPEKAHLNASIIHCKLQCYARDLHKLSAPVAALLFILIITPVITWLLYIPLKEKSPTAGQVRLLPLRAPPVFDLQHIIMCF
jgi:hypothetical protein